MTTTSDSNAVQSPATEPAGRSIFSSVLRRRKIIVLGIAAVVVVATVAFTARQTKIYVATASVVVQSQSSQQTPNAGPNMATEAQVADSLAVAQVVIDQGHLSISARQLDSDMSVHVPVDSQVLQFSYASPDPKVAQERAEAFANAYLTFRHDLLARQSIASAASLQARIASLTKRLSDLQVSFPSLQGQKLEIAKAQANAQATQIGLLEQRLGDINTAGNFVGGQLGPAPYPRSPARPRMLINVIVALFGGLLLGFGVAAAREYADDRIRSGEDLGSLLRAPVLGRVPTRRRVRAAAASGGLPALREPTSAEAEAFRGVRASLMFAMDGGARSVLMTSPDVDQGTTWAAANLAVALAATGRQVVLVSADLWRPCLAAIFGVEPRATLSDVLTNSADLRDAVRPTAVDGLWVVEGRSTIGHGHPAVAADLADSSTARRLVGQMAADFADVVLVCAPPLTAHADTINWAPACDAVVLVSDVRTTTHRHLAAAREQLERAHATVVGAVVIERGRWTWRLRGAISGGRSKAPQQVIRTSPDAHISPRVNAPESATQPGET